ncbi:helix-turn-helix domain-containing protein [Kosakonia sacchari]|uniref:helix-turn-helix domain-containing protein n=1 Tax=Kosakonia sacchari TaxID=1158459 RepID=UPI001362C1D0|nr:helix-turn-helix domain-containing protein [Kosakonia sacchari]QHM95979.1 helix-turn-helix domain-containing protein [Kosakonia sacchari]
MEKLTLTRKEAAAILGVSTLTVSRWVSEGRLKAYRVSNKPKSPYLFTREDCIAALSFPENTAEAELSHTNTAKKSRIPIQTNKAIQTELNSLLQIRTKGRMKDLT